MEEGRSPTPSVAITPDTTWLEIKNMQILEEEERKFVGIKSELRGLIEKMRDKLQKLMTDNDVRDEKERLGRDEFELDMDQRELQEEELKIEIGKTREQSQYDNLAKLHRFEWKLNCSCWHTTATTI